RVQLSGDLARAWLALPLATHADLGRDGGTGDRADWAKASLGTRSDSILPLGLQAEHELPIHASGGVPIEADVRGGRVRVAPGALQRLLQEQALPPGRSDQEPPAKRLVAAVAQPHVHADGVSARGGLERLREIAEHQEPRRVDA